MDNTFKHTDIYIIRDCLDILWKSLHELVDYDDHGMGIKEELDYKTRVRIDFALNCLCEIMENVDLGRLEKPTDLRGWDYQKARRSVMNFREVTGSVGLSEEKKPNG